MKWILLLLPVTIFAQAPKKTNTIIASGVTLRQGVEALIERGYIIDRMDTSFHTASTRPKNIKRTTATVVLQLREKDGDLIITGKVDPNVIVSGGGFSFKGSSSQIENIGMKGSDGRLSFEEMDAFAKSVNAKIRYVTR